MSVWRNSNKVALFSICQQSAPSSVEYRRRPFSILSMLLELACSRVSIFYGSFRWPSPSLALSTVSLPPSSKVFRQAHNGYNHSVGQLAYYWVRPDFPRNPGAPKLTIVVTSQGTNKFRSPRSQVPWWGFMVITQAPLYFLLGSVVAFSSGLVCFAFSAFPFTIIPTIVSLCTALTIASLFAVIFWLAGERWAFMKSRGRRWFISYVYPIGPDLLERVHISFFDFAKSAQRTWTSSLSFFRSADPRRRTSIRRQGLRMDLEARGPSMDRPSGPSTDTIVPGMQPPTVHPSTPRPVPSIAVRMASELESPLPNNRRKFPVMAAATAISRLSPLPPEHKHASPVLSLAFSPDGRTLASGSWDAVLHLWDVSGLIPTVRQSVTLPRGPPRQVCWSPDGRALLGRLRKAVFIWDLQV